jgi:hypothetical protein
MTPESVKQFQKLCANYGLELDSAQAREEGEKLLRLVEIVLASPLSKEEFDSLKRYAKEEEEEINN